MTEGTHYVVWKRKIDFEGFPLSGEILTIKHSRKAAEEFMEQLPQPDPQSRFEYIIKEI